MASQLLQECEEKQKHIFTILENLHQLLNVHEDSLDLDKIIEGVRDDDEQEQQEEDEKIIEEQQQQQPIGVSSDQQDVEQFGAPFAENINFEDNIVYAAQVPAASESILETRIKREAQPNKTGVQKPLYNISHQILQQIAQLETGLSSLVLKLPEERARVSAVPQFEKFVRQLEIQQIQQKHRELQQFCSANTEQAAESDMGF